MTWLTVGGSFVTGAFTLMLTVGKVTAAVACASLEAAAIRCFQDVGDLGSSWTSSLKCLQSPANVKAMVHVQQHSETFQNVKVDGSPKPPLSSAASHCWQ